MAEILGITSAALGLLPLAVEVVKGFHTLCRTVKTARACTKELETLDINLRTQERIFVNECELILHIISSDSREPRMMTQDLDHPLWSDGTLEGRIKVCMAQSYEQCIDIVKAMRECQQDLAAELSLFTVVRTERDQHESLRVTFRRLRKSLMISLDMSLYERKLDRIRQHNIGISSIRSQIGDFQKIQARDTRSQISEKISLSSWVSTIHEISIDAYTTLTSAFSCQMEEHTDHFAALRADDSNEKHTSVRLNMGLAYCLNRSHEQQQLLQFSLESCLPHPDWQTISPRRKMRVHFAEDLSETPPNRMLAGQQQKVSNLSKIENACAYLETSLSKKAPTGKNCLAYLYDATLCQHSFYVTVDRKAEPRYSVDQIGTLKDLMLEAREASLSITDQFKLAIKVTLAVLQFHSTPWLREKWNTSDLLLGTLGYPQPTRHTDLFLRSRLFSQTGEDVGPAQESGATPWDRKGKGVEGAQRNSLQDYDIDNWTLFSLGVALLEIGRWVPLSQMRLDGDPDDVVTAMRLAQQRTLLGRSYGDIVRRCMQCHFGYGHYLSKIELPSAVYNNVVCPLQHLVERLDRI
ncbi:hypothetical protein PG987_010361 [Apiospora arundinis]